MTKSTVSKHWRKPVGRRDQAWIPPEPLHNDTITLVLSAQRKGPNVTNPICISARRRQAQSRSPSSYALNVTQLADSNDDVDDEGDNDENATRGRWCHVCHWQWSATTDVKFDDQTAAKTHHTPAACHPTASEFHKKNLTDKVWLISITLYSLVAVWLSGNGLVSITKLLYTGPG